MSFARADSWEAAVAIYFTVASARQVAARLNCPDYKLIYVTLSRYLSPVTRYSRSPLSDTVYVKYRSHKILCLYEIARRVMSCNVKRGPNVDN